MTCLIDTNATHISTAGLGARVRMMFVIRRQRRALLGLDDRALADIGLSRQQALAEARRPFWDVAPIRDADRRGTDRLFAESLGKTVGKT